MKNNYCECITEAQKRACGGEMCEAIFKPETMEKYEEMVIDGVLHSRLAPKGKWKPFSAKELTGRLLFVEKRMKNFIKEALK